MKRPRANGDEQDAFSPFWRSVLHWQPGQLRRVKQRANRRERRNARHETSYLTPCVECGRFACELGQALCYACDAYPEIGVVCECLRCNGRKPHD